MQRNNVKKIPLLMVIIMIMIIILIIVILVNKNKKVKAGYVENGKVTYSEKIINKSYNKQKNLKTLEIASIDKDLNSVVVTNEIIQNIKDKSENYTRTVKEILESKSESARDSYNIKKALERKYIKEKTKFYDYYALITGFKNKKEFIKFCEDAFNLMEQDTNFN